MPRTKLNRNAGKRNRKSSTDDKIQMQLKDLDAMAETYNCDIEQKTIQFLDDISELIDMMRKKTPKSILKMTYGQLKALEIQSFNDLPIEHESNGTLCSVASSLSIILEKTVTKKFSHDEGYLTEDSNRTSSDNPNPPKSVLHPSRALGPLASAKARSRRSRSAGCLTSSTPGPQPMANHISSVLGKTKVYTPLLQQGEKATHTSRSKHRTPLVKLFKSVSVDRIGTITPKVQPYQPMAMLRHAKAGEAIFSVSGSPVVTSSITEEIANVNIPLKNGIMSIRPTEMQSVDANFVSRLDINTLSQLHQLKENLDLILRARKF